MLQTDQPYTTASIDPVVAEVHAVRAQEWARYGADTQQWFDDLLRHQAERQGRGVKLGLSTEQAASSFE